MKDNIGVVLGVRDRRFRLPLAHGSACRHRRGSFSGGYQRCFDVERSPARWAFAMADIAQESDVEMVWCGVPAGGPAVGD